ncbi:MAG: zinc ABC transporter substrate-binding protein [Acidihalobacter sp.]
MIIGRRLTFMLSTVLLALCSSAASAAPIAVVAAESTYGVIAEAIGGSQVHVDSIIKNPNVDPHMFEADPAVARRVAQAQVVVMNGIGYDDWMDKLLAANPNQTRQVVVAAKLDPFLVMSNQNPHIFYDPRVGLLTASHQANLKHFADSLLQVYAAAQQVMMAHPGLNVTATEPVAGYMIRELGYRSLNEHFQFSVMNGSEPSPQEVVRYENSLRQHKVSLLFYNQQVTDSLTERLRKIANESGVPVVGVDEFVPPNTSYPQWLMETLKAVGKAL